MPTSSGAYTPNGATWYASQTVEGTAGKSLKAAPGLLHYIRISNQKAATVYVYLFDSLSATGTLLMAPIPIPTKESVELGLPFAVPFGTGLFVASSSTLSTFTNTTTDDLMIHSLVK